MSSNILYMVLSYTEVAIGELYSTYSCTKS